MLQFRNTHSPQESSMRMKNDKEEKYSGYMKGEEKYRRSLHFLSLCSSIVILCQKSICSRSYTDNLRLYRLQSPACISYF